MKNIQNIFKGIMIIVLCFLATSQTAVNDIEGEGGMKALPVQQDLNTPQQDIGDFFTNSYNTSKLASKKFLRSLYSFSMDLFNRFKINEIPTFLINKVVNNEYYQKVVGTYVPYSEYDYILKRYSKDSPIMVHADIMARTITKISKKKTQQEPADRKSLITNLSRAMYCISVTSKQSNLDLKYIKKHSLNTVSKAIRYRNFMDEHEESLKHLLGRKYNCKVNNGRYIETSFM